tara:strand:- start:1722 stop:1949 length:228 start_codon:yes stop_codon:yes gene_type:complete
MKRIGNYVRKASEAEPLSWDQHRQESMGFLTLCSTIKAWSELASESRNKTEWNNFAKYVLTEVQEIAKEIEEAKK